MCNSPKSGVWVPTEFKKVKMCMLPELILEPPELFFGLLDSLFGPLGVHVAYWAHFEASWDDLSTS